MTVLVRIDQDIHNTQQAIANLISRIDGIHAEYSEAIARATQQQLLLAAFKFCTQKCPDAFLALSLSDRQKLQAELRDTVNTLREQIQFKLEQCDRDSRTNQENLDKLLGNLLEESTQSINQLFVKHKILTEGTSQNLQMTIRLAEIEFTDRHVMSHRGELRVFSARLAHLHKELEKKYQQKTIAEAELAWRETWME